VVGNLIKSCHTAGYKKTKTPTASKITVVRQLCNYIPNHLAPKLPRDTGVYEQARKLDDKRLWHQDA
jgi:hypothetical protein